MRCEWTRIDPGLEIQRGYYTETASRKDTIDKHAGACAPRYAHARVRPPPWSAPTYYYPVNDARAFETGKKGTLVRERAPIARSPNLDGYHEDESLFVGRSVGPDLFARHTLVARFDSSCRAVCRRICFAGGNLYGSWVGDTGDPTWAVPANASDAGAHATRITLQKQVGRGRQFLGDARKSVRCSGRGIPCWRSGARGLLRGLCHGTTFARHLLLILGR